MSKAVSSFSRWPETQWLPRGVYNGLNQTSRYGKTEAINGQAHGYMVRIFFEPKSLMLNRFESCP